MANIQRTEAKVKAVNAAHAYANQLHAQLAEVFAPLVGQKILKVDGTLLEKYKKMLPTVPTTPRLHVYRSVSDYSLAWTVKTSENDTPSTCLYYEITFYVGDLDHGVLTKLGPVHQLRTDYTVQEILDKREAYRKAKNLADEARSALYPFGEYGHEG